MFAWYALIGCYVGRVFAYAAMTFVVALSLDAYLAKLLCIGRTLW